MEGGWCGAYRDTDDAGLGDDVLGEVIKQRVLMVLKPFQLLLHIVQLDYGPEGLDVMCLVHRWRAEHQNRVVLT